LSTQIVAWRKWRGETYAPEKEKKSCREKPANTVGGRGKGGLGEEGRFVENTTTDISKRERKSKFPTDLKSVRVGERKEKRSRSRCFGGMGGKKTTKIRYKALDRGKTLIKALTFKGHYVGGKERRFGRMGQPRGRTRGKIKTSTSRTPRDH